MTTKRSMFAYLLGSLVVGGAIPVLLLFPRTDYEKTTADPPAAIEKSTPQHAYASSSVDSIEVIATNAPKLNDTSTTTHIRVTGGCDAFFGGTCLSVRAAPTTTAEKVHQLRNHTVLAVAEEWHVGSSTWYKIDVDDHLQYPERVTTNWYVFGDYVEPLTVPTTTATTSEEIHKRIEVDLSDQILTAFENNVATMTIRISTGLTDTPTPRGVYSVLSKTPSRYMQGPLENGRRTIVGEVPPTYPDYYDLPGVPWNLYFTHDGAVIHGAYWHVNFGETHSHGCVNVPPQNAEKLYYWAEVGTPVVIRY